MPRADKQATPAKQRFNIQHSTLFEVVSPSDDYALLDFGHGRRLERFGELIVDRPSPQATAAPAGAQWKADWVYTGVAIDKGVWQAGNPHLPRTWSLTVDGQTMQCRVLAGGQVGLYPEHIACWRWIRRRLDRHHGARVLNLFAASGGATLAAAVTGAEVDHVDAQAGALDLARHNLAASYRGEAQGQAGAAGPKIRFLRDDVSTFVQRARRQGRTYDLIVLDPPSFGRGPRGKTWTLARDLAPLLTQLAALLSEQPLGLWLSTHTRGWGAERLTAALGVTFPATGMEAGELGVVGLDGRVLASGHATILNFEL